MFTFNLPPEVLGMVMEELALSLYVVESDSRNRDVRNRTLVAVAHVSKAWKAVAERLLYSDLQASWDVVTARLLERTFDERKDLVGRVRTLRLDFLRWEDLIDKVVLEPEVVEEIQKKAEEETRPLEEGANAIAVQRRGHLVEDFARDLEEAPRWEKLEAAAPEMEEADWTGNDENVEEGCVHFFNNFLPRFPRLDALHLTYFDVDIPLDWAATIEALGRLKTLSYYGVDYELLMRLLSHTPKLQDLSVDLDMDDDEGYAQLGGQPTPTFPPLPNLRHLRHGFHVNPRRYGAPLVIDTEKSGPTLFLDAAEAYRDTIETITIGSCTSFLDWTVAHTPFPLFSYTFPRLSSLRADLTLPRSDSALFNAFLARHDLRHVGVKVVICDEKSPCIDTSKDLLAALPSSIVSITTSSFPTTATLIDSLTALSARVPSELPHLATATFLTIYPVNTTGPWKGVDQMDEGVAVLTKELEEKGVTVCVSPDVGSKVDVMTWEKRFGV
ncbi:f-box domain cyclin-like protein [Pseudohyphozyma bogoriensis]|nr:f-box domain cyclin-like protein [Pseudohyphozyma bogoriensis]